MKTTQLLQGLALGAAVGLALPVLPAASVTAGTPGDQAVALSQNQVIEGMVSAKASDNLTVNGTIIDTPATVECTRAGRPIMLADIQVGDRVRVLAFVDSDRGVAVSQTIRDLGP